MRDQFNQFDRMLMPISGMNRRISLVVCIVAALALLFLGRAEADVFGTVRQTFTNISSPIYSFVGPPLAAARSAVGNAFGIFTVYAENQRLREENARLLAWQDAALTLEQRVRRYEALLALPLDGETEYRTARIVSDPASPFAHTSLINVGTQNGIVAGQAVIGPEGLIGRTVSVGAHAARVLMLSDFNSRIPVAIEPSGARGILVGQNDNRPIVSFLPEEHEVEVGQRVVTSGHGGLLPQDIPVGFVIQVKEREAVIQLAARFDHLRYVRVLNYVSPFDGVPEASEGPPVFSGPLAELPTAESAAPQVDGQAELPDTPTPQGQ